LQVLAVERVSAEVAEVDELIGPGQKIWKVSSLDRRDVRQRPTFAQRTFEAEVMLVETASTNVDSNVGILPLEGCD